MIIHGSTIDTLCWRGGSEAAGVYRLCANRLAGMRQEEC